MELIRKYRQGKLTTADVRTLNYAVIGLMTLIGIVSIVWSMSLHILSGDVYNVLFGAKLAFRERDFSKLDARSKLILEDSLDGLSHTYAITNAALDNAEDSDGIANDMHIMPALGGPNEETSTTAKPKRKIAHLFQISSSVDGADADDDDDITASDDMNATTVANTLFNAEEDLRFLANMVIDIHQTRWRQTITIQFIYGFPFWSEIVAIIWIGMCLIYQSSVKKYWGLPKPWRIVIPSMLVFALMTLGSLVYTILANRHLKHLCTELRANLSNPSAISCGQAISVLRPLLRQHVFKHDVYLNLFHLSYLLNLVFWFLALLIVLSRYIFAIDFQLVDVPTSFDERLPPGVPKEEFVEVLLSSPQHLMKVPRVETTYKSEEDFQSAKSHLSEVATPLLEPLTQRVV